VSILIWNKWLVLFFRFPSLIVNILFIFPLSSETILLPLGFSTRYLWKAIHDCPSAGLPNFLFLGQADRTELLIASAGHLIETKPGEETGHFPLPATHL